LPAVQPAPAPAAPSGVSPQPNTALSPEQAGDVQLARKAYEAALQEYLRVSPKTAFVWNKIGVSYQQMFMVQQARSSYERAVHLDPGNASILNNLGTAYYSLKQYRDAERVYRRALKIDPRAALIYKNLGTDLMAEDKFKKGWECYQIALKIDPEAFDRGGELRIGEPGSAQSRGAINYYLARSYARAGMPSRAVDYLRMAIDEGYTDRKKVLADREFASLRGFSPFEQLIAEQRVQ
jgi:tetratricopeptide (TPR) repeat protein